jgi:tetratricopeptide (TPR) repeat protein
LIGVAGALADPDSVLVGRDDPGVHLSRGNAHLDAKEYNKAIAEYTRAIELRPDFAEAYNNRAYATYSKYDGIGDPLTDLNRALELRPEFPHAYNTRGCVYMAAGEPDKALADFNRAIQVQPDYPRAYRNRANVQLRKGHIGLAIADFERAGGNPKRIILYLLVVTALILGALTMAARRVVSISRQASRKRSASRSNERWPRDAGCQFGCQKRAAIGDLIVRCRYATPSI